MYSHSELMGLGEAAAMKTNRTSQSKRTCLASLIAHVEGRVIIHVLNGLQDMDSGGITNATRLSC